MRVHQHYFPPWKPRLKEHHSPRNFVFYLFLFALFLLFLICLFYGLAYVVRLLKQIIWHEGDDQMRACSQNDV